MKKRILALITALSLICIMCFSVSVNAEKKEESITAINGEVTIKCDTTAQEGTPVGIFILPAIIENTVDVTAEKIGAINSPQSLRTLNVEYVTYVKADEDGSINHTCTMKDSLPTGKCHVVFAFYGEDKAYIAGSFEHVGKNDVNSLVKKFNDSTAGNYDEIIDEDVNGELESDGETRKLPKEILSKSSADITYYSELSDKAAFCEVLFSYKPEGGFDISSLISGFNEAIAWIKLRNEEDTLSVLKAYNGEEDGKYWNIELEEDSDYFTLSENERVGLLNKIKKAGYTESSDLEKAFNDMIVLALFRMVGARSSLEALIDEDGKYAVYFEKVNEIIKDAKLDTYSLATLYNNVLKNGANASCESFSEIEKLFEDSIPEKTSSGGSSGGSGGGGGTSLGSNGGGFKNSTTISKTEDKTDDTVNIPFGDVEKTHWANEYISKLYQSGAINGVSATVFNPSGSVQRQDFVKILIGALGMKLSENNSEFSDIVSGEYYEKYVMTAFENGFISGIGDGAFGVGCNLKREDAAVIMARVLESYGAKSLQAGKTFNDDAQISSYAKEAVKKVSAAGIFGGDNLGNFNPKGSLSRAEACAILCRLADSVKGE